MRTKTLNQYSCKVDDFNIYIGTLINNNGSIRNRSKFISKKNSKEYSVCKNTRQLRYKLNKEKDKCIEEQREELRLIEEKKAKELERTKQLEKDKLRYESMTDEIDMGSELEDMESYI